MVRFVIVSEWAHDDWLWNESTLATHDQTKNLTSLASQPERSLHKIRKRNRLEELDLRRVNPICIVDDVKRETRQLTDERKTDCGLDETNRALFGESTSTQHLVFLWVLLLWNRLKSILSLSQCSRRPRHGQVHINNCCAA